MGGGCEWLLGATHSVHDNRDEIKREQRTEGTCMEQPATPLSVTAEMTDSPRDQLGAIGGNRTGNFLPNEGPKFGLATLT